MTKTIQVAVGIIKKDNQVLVAQRPDDKPYSGYWEFPGGKIEADETGLQALKRELHEELGIEVITAQHSFNHYHSYPDKKVLLELWLVTEINGEPHGKENQVIRWASMEDILNLRLFEGNWAILEKIKELLL